MNKLIYTLFIGLVILGACIEDPKPTIELDESPYVLEYGALPIPDLPLDNALTIQGVQLGRMLFYETLLSKDNSQSCASCHSQQDAFSDTLQFSIGVEDLPGKRQAMPVFNLAWHNNEFFWDGRANLLRDQALKPIEDPLEMNETLDNVILKLSNTQEYKDQFTRTFGSDEITSDKMALALEQFMLSVVSYESRYDQYKAGQIAFTESEERGRILYETEYNPFFPELSGADCVHCHGGANFENDQYMNNGLDTDDDITDEGRELVTGLSSDKAKFKVPSLRNIELTPPYMHDGRFKTLEEVIDHYDNGIHPSSTLDPALLQVLDNGGLKLTEQDKIDLKNFLLTLTDEQLVQNPTYSDPF